MQHCTADQLYVVVHHVPGNVSAGGCPVVLIDGLIAPDLDIVLFDAEVAVELGGRGPDLGTLTEAAGGFFDDGKSLGEDLFEDLLEVLVAFFFEFIGLLVDGIASVQVGCRQGFRLLLFFGDLGIDGGQVLGDAGFELPGLAAQLVV